MILAADSKGPDQNAWMQSHLGLCCLHLPWRHIFLAWLSSACMHESLLIDLKVTIYWRCVFLCAVCVRFQLCTVTQFAMLSIRLRFMSVIHMGDCDSYLQFMLAIHICDSGLLSFFFFCIIIIITLWVNSADNKLIYFLIFPESWHHHFIQIVSWWDILPEMSNLFTGKIRKRFQNVICWIFSPEC